MGGFNQTFHGPIGQVINSTGNVILSQESDIAQLISAISKTRDEITASVEMPSDVKEKALGKIDAAVDETKKSVSDKSKIIDDINDAAEIVKGAGNFVTNSKQLAETLFAIAKWVMVFI